jgi:putative ABC transport system ATP-binding protein
LHHANFMTTAAYLKDVSFGYRSKKPILTIPEWKVSSGDRVFLFGPSGSGKTTLLGLLSGVLVPQTGIIQILGQDMKSLSAAQRDRFRGSEIGYIFQSLNLISYLTVEENIALPCELYRGRRLQLGEISIRKAVQSIAQRLDIEDLLMEKANNLSVGQQQRVAAARALIGLPRMIIADEPTSSLDSDRREGFIRLLFENCRASGSTLIFVSHDRSLIPLFDFHISLPDINKTAL